MLELILNATKVLLSKDVREGAASLVDLVNSMPEWQQGICTLEAKIIKANREQARFLLQLSIEKMENLDFPDDAIYAFEMSFLEATQNAFEHACRKDSDVVRFSIDISETYGSFSIVNPRKKRFDVEKNLERAKELLIKNPQVRRGRGLIEISSLADKLISIENEVGLKAVFYSDRVRFIIDYFDDLVVLSLVRGMGNPSLPWRILNLAQKYYDYDVLLSFAGWGVNNPEFKRFDSIPDPSSEKRSRKKRTRARSTNVMSALTDAVIRRSNTLRDFIVLEEPEENSSEDEIPSPSMIVTSLYTALDRLNRLHLYDDINAAIYKALDEQ